MVMGPHLVIAASVVTRGWKWAAAGIGFGVVAAVLLAVILTGGGLRGLRQLTEGADGVPSTSKFQWFVWLLAVLFSYAALWALRAKQGQYGGMPQIPTNVLTVLGFSTATMAAAKGITGAYAQSGRLDKTMSTQTPAGGLLKDDTGVPELAKVQMLAFTTIAVGVFLAAVIHELTTADPGSMSLPDIDGALLVMMGISQGGYLAKKVVSPLATSAPAAQMLPAPAATPSYPTAAATNGAQDGTAARTPTAAL